jgi:hypothetical protein
LKGAIEVWTRRYLWTPADAINFKPALCGNVYGDGRALFGLSTLNLRPSWSEATMVRRLDPDY